MRGGAHVVYYYHNEAMPMFALTAYAKNERADITQADRVKGRSTQNPNRGFRRKAPRQAFTVLFRNGVPKGIRTPVTAVRGRCPGPLDDGDIRAGQGR